MFGLHVSNPMVSFDVLYMTIGGAPEVALFFSLGPRCGLDARGNGKQEDFPCCGRGGARSRELVKLVRSQHRAPTNNWLTSFSCLRSECKHQ